MPSLREIVMYYQKGEKEGDQLDLIVDYLLAQIHKSGRVNPIEITYMKHHIHQFPELMEWCFISSNTISELIVRIKQQLLDEAFLYRLNKRIELAQQYMTTFGHATVSDKPKESHLESV